MAHPVIVYVPGLLPKPESRVHREALLRCLLAGLRRTDPEVANAVEENAACFDVVSWTFDFYQTHRDIALDRDAIDAVVEQSSASERDIAEATSWRRRLARWVYQLGDWMPFLIPHLASERMEMHLRDLMRYEHNKKGIADHIRRMLKVRLQAVYSGEHPMLLIGHSMGSVIAYDSLWELSHCDPGSVRIDRFLTMGSPLGQRFMQKRLLGNDRKGRERFPDNIRCWNNLSAIGDLTSIDPWLANDFADMLRLGLIDEISDDMMLNYYRLDGVLNVHAEYGYLANEKTALTIGKWWRGHDSDLPR